MKTKTLMLWIGGGALAALAIGGVAYAATTKPPAVPAAPTPTGTPVGMLQPGQGYLFGAPTPTGVTTAQALATALKAAGWTNVKVWAFGGQTGSTNFPGLPAAPANGYMASGVWNGTTTNVPSGVVAIVDTSTASAPFSPLATA